MTDADIIRRAMAILGARGGKSTTPAQTAARKRNGAKGGRPKKPKPK